MKLVYSLIFGAALSCSSPGEVLTRVGSDQNNSRKVSYLPENNLDHEEVQFYGQSGTSEQDFNLIIDNIEQIYGPIIQQLGGNLIVERKYSDNTVNAYAQMDGDNWIVSMFGGLAKRVTPEGFSMVICHELGHFLNGYVYYQDSWASSEGGSDGYSAQVCARKVFSQQSGDNCDCGFLPENKEYSQFTQCEKFRNDNEKLICERTLSGALSLAGLLASLNKEPVPTLNNLDRSIAKRTKLDHPNARCRLSVYYEGAMSTKQWNDGIIPKNKAELMQYGFQTKPNCWYSGK
jgi:hypothetical protein